MKLSFLTITILLNVLISYECVLENNGGVLYNIHNTIQISAICQVFPSIWWKFKRTKTIGYLAKPGFHGKNITRSKNIKYCIHYRKIYSFQYQA